MRTKVSWRKEVIVNNLRCMHASYLRTTKLNNPLSCFYTCQLRVFVCELASQKFHFQNFIFFIQDCVFDACAYDDITSAIDANVGAYAQICREKKVQICSTWRNDTKTGMKTVTTGMWFCQERFMQTLPSQSNYDQIFRNLRINLQFEIPHSTFSLTLITRVFAVAESGIMLVIRWSLICITCSYL